MMNRVTTVASGQPKVATGFKAMSRRLASFTLLELLLVIAIIMVLATLALPAVVAIRDKTKKEQTGVACSQVAVACQDYMLQYGKWPDMSEALYCSGLNTTITREVDANLVNILRGANYSSGCANQGNPKLTVFMEIPSRMLDGNGNMIDRWGTPLRIKFDANFDNVIAITGVSGTIGKGVAVVSAGKDKNISTWTDNVYNW